MKTMWNQRITLNLGLSIDLYLPSTSTQTLYCIDNQDPKLPYAVGDKSGDDSAASTSSVN